MAESAFVAGVRPSDSSHGAESSQQVVPMGEYPNGYSLIEDGALALDDLITERYVNSVSSPETPDAQDEYRYILRNDQAARRHRVVPLIWKRKELQHGMKVTNESGTDLVQADSTLCARVAQRYVRSWVQELTTELESYFDEEFVVPDRRVKRIIRPPMFSEVEKDDQEEAWSEIEANLDQWSSALETELDFYRTLLTLATESSLSAVPAAVRSESEEDREWIGDILQSTHLNSRFYQGEQVQSMSEDLQEFGEFLERYLTQFIPFVILEEPIGWTNDDRFREYRFLRHELSRVPTTSRNLSENLQRVVRGRYTISVPYSLNEDASSCHFQVELTDGVKISEKSADDPTLTVGPHRLDPLFRPEPRYRDWEAREHSMFAFYRQRDDIRLFATIQRQIRIVRQETEGRTESRAPEDMDPEGPPKISLRLVAQEYSTTKFLSGLMFALAVFGVIDVSFLELIPLSTYLLALVSIAATLAIFSFGKPLIREPIGWRVVVSFIVFLLGVVIIGDLTSPDPALGRVADTLINLVKRLAEEINRRIATAGAVP